MAQNASQRPDSNITSVNLQGESLVNTYASISSVASSTTTTIVSYTVPALSTFYLLEAESSGNNIAIFELVIDGSVEGMWRTWFSTEAGKTWNFRAGLNRGFSIDAGKIILIRVTHTRPSVGDFEGRIYGILKV